MNLASIEQETIINYNQGEAEAIVFTYDKALIRKLERLREKNPAVELLREEKTGAREYRIPKSWIGIKIPRVLRTAERERIKNQGTEALKRYHRSAHAQHPSQSPEIALPDSESNGRALG